MDAVGRGPADAGFRLFGMDDRRMRLTREMDENRRPGVMPKHASYDSAVDLIDPDHATSPPQKP